MNQHGFRSDFDILKRHYNRLLDAHGDSARAVHQSDRQTQEQRMQILSEVADLKNVSILDWGCGTGHLLDYLKRTINYKGAYTGYDIVPAMIRMASRNNPNASFECRDILAEGINQSFDYVLINGVFNNRIRDNWGFMTRILALLVEKTTHAVAFNAFSTYVDYKDDGLFYVDPEKVFRFCMSLSRRVVLRHDYYVRPGVGPFEFTVYIYTTDKNREDSNAECL